MTTLQDKFITLQSISDEMRKLSLDVTAESLLAYWNEKIGNSATDIDLADCRSYLLGNMYQAVVKAAFQAAKDPYNQ